MCFSPLSNLLYYLFLNGLGLTYYFCMDQTSFVLFIFVIYLFFIQIFNDNSIRISFYYFMLKVKQNIKFMMKFNIRNISVELCFAEEGIFEKKNINVSLFQYTIYKWLLI